ncbi:uncharacterized protein si:dkey-103g5.4 isoform X3 [Melanotaenia boesemani]|uniref:uncharacterized protein si:dkey-103g5.4 isoform X3 n=1 Tax=Melanotaenia boesemani TaxID=1250792 RepID=UPI001C045E94|nr:uncharacterized protein si:dkey-103g5.4 isoform X3 [Melanotaenia boesemani]
MTHMWCGCLWWLFAPLSLTLAQHNNFSHHNKERPPCRPGFYCPLGSLTPVPCPKGTFGPTVGAESIESCLKCPPHHYCPRPGLYGPLPCGPLAQQPLSGEDTCTCLGEGQSFQTSDGECQCTISYQPTTNGDLCVQQLFGVCRDGKSRTQYGDCLDRYQWSLHCRQEVRPCAILSQCDAVNRSRAEVCQAEEDYRGYDGELGLCICREPSGRAACGGLCRRKLASELELQCHSDGNTELVWSHENQVSRVSGIVLETIFKQGDSQENLLCNSYLNSSRPVYIVQTTESGFFGVLSGLPKELQQLFPDTTQWDFQSSAEKDYDFFHEVSSVENTSYGGRDINSRKWRGDESDMEESSLSGVLNPTTCLHLGDILLFTVNTLHYPQYDNYNLYNTNSDFDWGPFRLLKEEMTLSWTPPAFFSLDFSQPGVYVFTLSSHQHKHLYVRVMPAGGQCYESGPFFPTIPRHVTRMGINRRRDLLLQPDWLVTGGLVFGAVVILCLCVTVLILFREYGWPEKDPIKVRYRLLQLAYQMDDYASKGSRVISLRKTHRKQQARMTQDSIQPVCTDALEEFWDYEHQVDLEAFSSNTFYSLLLKQSLSVTTRLGKLTTEVKELYQGVLEKLQLLHPRMIAEERVEEGYERMRREMEREVVRRKSLASQLRTLLDSQLQVLSREQHAKQRVYSMFMCQLRECTRLLSKMYNNQPSCDLHQQIFTQKLTSLVGGMGELVSAECRRQGAWGLLGEGTGAKLLCPDTGTVLTKDDMFGPDGSLQVSRTVHCDSVTGLIRPNPHSHMLLSSGHTMAVPPEFFIHPQTGRVMPITGNVAFDPSSSTLVFTTDLCTGDNRKWDRPLIPFIPYPTSCHSDQPLPSARLKGLRLGQKLQLGIPMTDPETGVLVPILAVTIHPQTGLVYPLGRLHTCPLTHLPQPIQIGYPMLDSRTGNVVLTVGVSLDPVTGDVLPVGGVLLAESFLEPLSGRMVKVGGASMRAGQLVPNAGGYQTLLESKVLAAMFKVLDILKPLNEEWGSDPTLQHLQPHLGNENANGRQDHLLAVTKELEQAWGRSLHCQLQLQTRLEMLLDWAMGLQQDGGILGDMPLPSSDMCVPALLGMDYPDPVGSGLSVPVLGSQIDPDSGNTIPLAGTMEDPDGKGMVAIRYGSQTVDPVTGLLAPVVGARLDVVKKIIVPVTASYWLMMAEQLDSVQAEALQREVCLRNTYWQQQRQREEDILTDLDSALHQCLTKATDTNSYQAQWSGRLREATMEMQDAAQTEAQRKASQHSYLALILPSHVLHILTMGDEEEWDQQCVWHSALMSGLDKVDVCMDQLQQENEKRTTEAGDWSTKLHAMDRELRQKELWEQCNCRQTELEAAFCSLHFVRLLSQLHANTAQAVLCGNFWFKDYGLVHCSRHRPNMKWIGLLQQRALPLLERLNQLLDEKQSSSFSPNTCSQHISATDTMPDSGLLTKQTYCLEMPSRVWTASVPGVKGISAQCLKEPGNIAQSLQASLALTHNSQRHTALSGIHSPGSQQLKDSAQSIHIAIPTIPEVQWTRLLELSPLFQLLKGVEEQLKVWAGKMGLTGGEIHGRGKNFIDVLDAQWECEGELIPLDLSVLSPREFLVYQHGLFLMQTLHNLKLTSNISLQIAASLPDNNYFNNAFRNSFFYQEAEETLFVRRQRLQSVGGFSLMLLHCLSHVKIKDMSSDSSPAFQRLFFKTLQECLGELFQARLGMQPSGQETNLCVWIQEQEPSLGDLKEALLDSHTTSLLHKLRKPSKGLLSEDQVEKMQKKHKETALFSHLEGLLRERCSEAAEKEDQMG